MSDGVRTPFTRLFTTEDRAGPANSPKYQGFARALGPNVSFGNVTAVREPDPARYGSFRIIDQIRGEPALPAMSIEVRHQYQLSEFLRLGRKNCPIDIQVRYGKCADPQDLAAGWEKIIVLEGAVITDWSTAALGAFMPGEDAVINETIPTMGLDFYEIMKMAFGEKGASTVTREMIDISICDHVTCGICGLPSDGSNVFFGASLATGASPGLAADIVYSADGGTTIGITHVSTLPVNLDPNAVACVGTNLAVVSGGDAAVHYAAIADILAGTDVWTRVAANVAGGPRAIFSRGTRLTWMVGLGGYIYFTSDITVAPTIQDAGVATTQQLNAIHGFDDLHLVAVGASNAVVFTVNGGATWSSVTGPTPGVALNTVVMRSVNEWFVGTAGGELWYTRNAGVTWTKKAFNSSGTGAVNDITFVTPTVGYMAHATATKGRILRSVDGGYSWYVMPEVGNGSIPTNLRINAVVGTGSNPNIVYGAGVQTAGGDGIIVKAA